jgi:hypothetical protein
VCAKYIYIHIYVCVCLCTHVEPSACSCTMFGNNDFAKAQTWPRFEYLTARKMPYISHLQRRKSPTVLILRRENHCFLPRCMWLIGASQLLKLVCYTICRCLVLGLISKIFPMSEEAEVDVVPEARRSWDWYYLCLADELVVKHCRILWAPLPCRHRTGKGKHKKHKRKEQDGTQATSFP